MSKIIMSKTSFERCVYPVLKEALEDLTGMTFREMFGECEGMR